jgi:hypothetical protein
MANWEDDLIAESAGNEEETPIFTALYLEYREAAFRRIGFRLQQEVKAPGEAPGKDARREAAITRAQEEEQEAFSKCVNCGLPSAALTASGYCSECRDAYGEQVDS